MKTVLTLLSFLLISGASLSAQDIENTYCNNRFGFCVTYSENVYLAAQQPVNGDGIILHNADKDIKINIEGSHNVMDWTPEKILTYMKEDFGIDQKAEVEVVSSDVKEEGYEAIISSGDQTQHSRMWSAPGSYLVILIQGPSEKAKEIETLWEELIVDIHDLEK